ncbi:MAG TPA: GNAT family N-acetyltransferase [Candidatus Limnocylindrales bacterium]|nr:GNAT family N-acetyltransferase [Candidatus Limnocylindrales bacterium]
MIIIRRAEAADEQRWRELWEGYTRFYEREPVEAITRHTWARILDPAAPVHALVAVGESTVGESTVGESAVGESTVGESAGIVGIANYLTHENTSTLTPVCYLQDLFVDPAARGSGVGRRLIDALWEEVKANGWAGLYWQTKEDNYRARALYDSYTPHSGFVRYVLKNDSPGSAR